MHPKMGTDMRRPLLPSWRYSHLEFSTDSLSEGGRFSVAILYEVASRPKVVWLNYGIVIWLHAKAIDGNGGLR